jgi:membrane fusion protein, copper/silver efflux system
MKKWINVIVALIVVFLAGMLGNHYLRSGSKLSSKSTAQKPRKILFWVAPMDPTYRRDRPGKSPMGMDLVPVYVDGQADAKGTIKISPVVENNLGVKTAVVKRMDLSRLIDTVGYVTVDENNIEHIHTYTDGWVKMLNVRTMGELVKKDELLLELYSPTLNNAQEEFLLALKNKRPTLIRAGEKKLLTLGMAQSQINQLRQTRRIMARVKVYASRGGVVSQLNIREGKYVKPDTDIMTIEDLSHVWVIAEVFERQANWLSVGQPAIATFPYIPGKAWQGKVDYVYPELSQQTHTLRVRLTFPNPDFTLKPKMYANIKILSRTIKKALAIPRAALIRTGEGDRVILFLGNGRYKAEAVKLGIESGDYYQILSGLKAGDIVVTSAQFLIDSESNLKAAFSRLQNQGLSTKIKSTTDTPQQFVGMGNVKSINVDKRTLSLKHQAIPALNMPAMTMELPVAKNISLGKIKLGDEIHFVMIKKDDGTYLIIKIHVVVNDIHQHE